MVTLLPPVSIRCRHEVQKRLYAFLGLFSVDIDIPKVTQEVLRAVSVEQFACAHESEDSFAGRVGGDIVEDIVIETGRFGFHRHEPNIRG